MYHGWSEMCMGTCSIGVHMANTVIDHIVHVVFTLQYILIIKIIHIYIYILNCKCDIVEQVNVRGKITDKRFSAVFASCSVNDMLTYKRRGRHWGPEKEKCWSR